MDLYNLSAYDYDLPKELIAQNAHNPADECKLLYFNWKLNDLIFKDILSLLSDKDVLFFNNSKVVKARIQPDENIKFFIVKDWEEKECKNCEILFLRKIMDEIRWESQMRADEKEIKNRHAELVSASKETDSEINSEWQSPRFLQNSQISVFEALVRPWKKMRPWIKIKIQADKEYWFEVLDYTQEGRIIKYLWEEDIFEVLEKIWKMPLPPYIEYSKEKEKPYQPVQAKKNGSVAAPTASLHFTPELFQQLKDKWVDILESTLHVWMWTFKPVDVEDIKSYDIHSELVEIPSDIFTILWELKLKWKNIVAVWTTATRILESLPYLYKRLVNSDYYQKIKNDYFDELVQKIPLEDVNKFIDWEIILEKNILSFNTKLYIFPWFDYKIIDKLITNFHLPKSSLLMLVSAFMWYDNMKLAYKHAIDKKYRFFSFWDAMFIDKKFT